MLVWEQLISSCVVMAKPSIQLACREAILSHDHDRDIGVGEEADLSVSHARGPVPCMQPAQR